MSETTGKKADKEPVKKQRKKQDKKANKQKGPNYAQLSLSTKRVIFSVVALILLTGGYVGLFFVPDFPGWLWLRLVLAFAFALLMGTAIFFLIKKRLTGKDLEFIKDEENFARAIKVLKQTKFYTKKFPGFPHGVRKEIFPAMLSALIIFGILCFVSPCRPPKAPLPDFSQMAAQEFYYPYLFAVSESQAILAPPQLSPETEEWAEKIPDDYLELTMYTDLFRNHFASAYAQGNCLAGTKTFGVLTAMAQASMLVGEYSRAATEYEQALKLKQTPEVAFQRAIALAYAGNLKEAETALEDLNEKEVRLALNDEFALPHWKTIVKILQGDISEETLEDYRNFEKMAKEVKSKPASVSQKSTANSSKSKSASRTMKDEEISKAMLEAKKAQWLQDRRLMSTSNNAAVLQLFTGNYANAIPTANSVLHLAQEKPLRSSKIIQMCAINTKGYAVGILGSSKEDKVKDLLKESVFDSCTGYFTKVTQLYEEIRNLGLAEMETLDPNFRKAPFYLIPQTAEMGFTLTKQFTSKQFPDSKSMCEKYASLLTQCETLHKSWNAANISRVPAYAIPVENLLMRTSLILDGVDREENYQLALNICNAKLLKENSLPLLATRTLQMELNVLARFAADEMLAIGMQENLTKEQEKTAKLSGKSLPELHPLFARQDLCALRLLLIKKGLTNKDFMAVNKAFQHATSLVKDLNLPPENSLVQECDETQVLLTALKKKKLEEVQEVFQTEIEKNKENLFRQSWVYRDLGFALQHRNFATEADAANRSARAIFNQKIFGNSKQHFLLLQIDKILNR